MLDTGADNLYLDSTFFASNNLSYNNMHTETLSGIGNELQKILVVDDSVNFNFGRACYRTSDVVILQLKPAGGDFVDGLLGTSYFMHNALAINFVEQYLVNYASLDSVNLAGYRAVEMTSLYHSPAVSMSIHINDTLSLSGLFIVDVGSPTTTLTSAAVVQHSLDQRISHKARYYTPYGGIGGESSGYDFLSPLVRLADFNFNNVTISYSLDTAGILADEAYLGILGCNILNRFNLIFDFKNAILYLKPNCTFAAPFEYDRMGFTFNDRTASLGGWVVTSLTQGSQAERCGLKNFDLIKSVNGLPVSNIPYLAQKHFFDTLEHVDLAVERDGQLLRFSFDLIPVLQDYFVDVNI